MCLSLCVFEAICEELGLPIGLASYRIICQKVDASVVPEHYVRWMFPSCAERKLAA
jgi:hypothetical protein